MASAKPSPPPIAYVGEGMANIVFSCPDATRGVAVDLLIRVPKDVTSNYGPIQEHWRNHIAPLFSPGDLVPQSLATLQQIGLELDWLRRELERAEAAGRRKPKFKGSRIKENPEYVMLIRDMRPRHNKEVTIEFKPKWLEQSPTAPPGAKRCRNCAREALRNNKKGTRDPILCPLRLLDRNPAGASLKIVEQFITDGHVEPTSAQATNLRNWLLRNFLMPHLREVQVANDKVGVLQPTDPFRLGIAMTLRDCTCYVRLPTDRQAVQFHDIEARLGDLDLKDQTTKLDYWKDMELKLHNEGYYHCTEAIKQKTLCLLEKEK